MKLIKEMQDLNFKLSEDLDAKSEYYKEVKNTKDEEMKIMKEKN